jgi:tRNA-splicing ligase RtcB
MSRRADPSEARARELAIAAGVDPDGRVPKPGSERGMPAWCTFRDAACAELNAREAQETAATIVNLRPQGPEYRNSPLTVIGDHDAATIAQMRNCMAVGNAVAGVICADGHLGYAQPRARSASPASASTSAAATWRCAWTLGTMPSPIPFR